MKKINVFLVMCTVVLLSACNNENSETKYDIVNSCNLIGQFHNRGLDYVFKNVTRAQGNTEMTEDEFEELCMNYAEQCLQEEEILDISDYYQANIEQEIHNAYEAAMEWAINNHGNDEEICVSDMIDSLDAKYAVKNEIQEIVTKIGSMRDTFLQCYLSSKENAICMSTNYDDVEKAMILSVIAIGKYSADYWENPNNNDGISTKRIIKADAVGAVRGLWRGRLVIGFCSMVGGPASGGAAALRYALLDSFLSSAAYAFVESCETYNNGERSGELEFEEPLINP